MFVLGLDVETTGLDNSTDKITEIGAVLWDVVDRKPIAMVSELCHIGDTVVTEQITKITGITAPMLQEFGKPLDRVMGEVNELASHALYHVAHNAPFDRGFLSPAGLIEKPWIDTRLDLPEEAYQKGKSASLGYLAADHGFLNPFPHRAVTDVLTMLTLMGQYNFDKIEERSHSPVIRVNALVTFDEKQKAKDCGFYWDPTYKQWYRNIKECDLVDLKPQWDFNIRLSEVRD